MLLNRIVIQLTNDIWSVFGFLCQSLVLSCVIQFKVMSVGVDGRTCRLNLCPESITLKHVALLSGTAQLCEYVELKRDRLRFIACTVAMSWFYLFPFIHLSEECEDFC